MDESKKTKKALLEGLQVLRSRVAELERIEERYKRTETALRESEERYARAEEMGHFGHWERYFDEDKAIWSEESYRIFGVHPNNFQPSYKSFLNLVHPCDRDRVKNALEAASAHGKGFDIEYRIVRPDGAERVLHSVAEVRSDKSGRPLKLVGTAHDITERKQAEQELRKAHDESERRVEEQTATLSKTNVLLKDQIAERKQANEALRQSEEKWRTLVENVPDVILTVDTDGTILFLNHTVPPFTPEKAIGTSVYDYVPAEYQDTLRKSLEHVLQTGEPYSYELAGKGPHGRTSWYQSRMGPVKHGGQVVAVILIATDITEHKKAEEELRESEERLRSALSAADMGTWRWDPVINQDTRDASFNRILGLSAAESTQPVEDFLQRVHPDDRDMVDKEIQCSIRDRRPYLAEFRIVRPDGAIRWLRDQGKVLCDENDRVSYMTGAIVDITERKKAEEGLIQSEEKYRSVIENIGIGVSLISPNMEILALNAQLRQWFPDIDVSKKPICYKTFNIPPREHVCSYCPTCKSLKDGQVHEAVTETPAGDKIVNYRIVSSPIKDRGGKVIAAIEMVEDFTEQKKAEDALRESEERYKELFESAAEGIAVADIETKMFKYVNPAICQMLGYTEEELKRMGVRDIHPKEDLEYVISEFEAQAREEKTLSLDVPCLRKDGTIMYADINTASVVIDGRQYNVGFFTDITERKKTEDELLFKSTLLEAQSETSIDGFLVVDGEGKSILFNKRFGQMWNIPQKILDTRDDEKMLQYVLDQLKDPNQFLEKVTYLYAHKNEKSRDEIQFKDGKVFDRYSSPLIDSNGNHYGRIWYFGDITERKKAEEALQKARDELEIRVAQRTADLAKAIKDLQNEIGERKKAEQKLLISQKQLRSLASELSLAEERLRRRIATNVHDHIGQNLAISKIRLESLRESASSPALAGPLEEICELIAQTIESSRSLTFELSPPVLYEMGFEAAVEWLTRRMRQQHGLSTNFKSDGRPKPLSFNVRILLFQAVRELLVNVAKHAKARNVTVSTRRVGDEVQVTVEDDGIGFDTAKTSSHNYETEGFGLFSIRERLGYLGGHFDIESRPGLGTKVTLAAHIDHESEKPKEKRK
jgi:PAS domain S-box-containing protein